MGRRTGCTGNAVAQNAQREKRGQHMIRVTDLSAEALAILDATPRDKGTLARNIKDALGMRYSIRTVSGFLVQLVDAGVVDATNPTPRQKKPSYLYRRIADPVQPVYARPGIERRQVTIPGAFGSPRTFSVSLPGPDYRQSIKHSDTNLGDAP